MADRPIRVYASVRPLPLSCRPCHVTRNTQTYMTFLAMHPGTPRVDVIRWMVENLTKVEQNAYRAAMGVGPIGAPLEDWMLEGVISGEFLPESLLTTAERALRRRRDLAG